MPGGGVTLTRTAISAGGHHEHRSGRLANQVLLLVLLLKWGGSEREERTPARAIGL
jgi:hypothetical protein